MKILLTHNNFSIQGGAEVFYHEVARVLEEQGHEVAYFSSKENPEETQWDKYFPQASSYEHGNFLTKLSSFPNMVYNRQAKQKMSEIIRDFQPDLIHAFAIYVKLTPSILEAASEANIPVVMSCNDYKYICPNYKLFHHGRICIECKGGRFYNAVKNKCSHNSITYSAASAIEAYVHNYMDIYRKNIHTFLFSSSFMAKKYEEFWGVNSFQWKQLRNPFDSTKFEATFSPNGAVLYFGRIIDEKGVDILIKAASKLPDIDFRIVGDGPDLVKLKNLSQSLKLKNIVFTGAKWGEDIEEELKDCRFVVVPSLWHENFPYVINQSFAHGKPVIGSNRGGIPEMVIHEERGLIYEATDPKALAESIRSLWSDTEINKIMGQKAKKFSDIEFNDESLYQTLHSIYSSVLSS